METTARVGRNEPCPCGSGKKYKACCEGRVEVVAEVKPAPYRLVGVTIIGLVVVAVVALRFVGKDEPAATPRTASVILPPTTATTTINPVTSGTPAAQPPGPVPIGKVWSAEHGHWHDAPGVGSSNAPMPIAVDANGNALTSAAPASFTPQPAGAVPDGKVWSTEHGHWHEVAPAAQAPR